MEATEYRLVALQRLLSENYMSATIEPFNKEETSQALIDGDNSFKDALWNYCEGNWGNLKAITVKDDDGQIWVKRVEHIS
jgi:hypothetical protein